MSDIPDYFAGCSGEKCDKCGHFILKIVTWEDIYRIQVWIDDMKQEIVELYELKALEEKRKGEKEF